MQHFANEHGTSNAGGHRSHMCCIWFSEDRLSLSNGCARLTTVGGTSSWLARLKFCEPTSLKFRVLLTAQGVASFMAALWFVCISSIRLRGETRTGKLLCFVRGAMCRLKGSYSRTRRNNSRAVAHQLQQGNSEISRGSPESVDENQFVQMIPCNVS